MLIRDRLKSGHHYRPLLMVDDPRFLLVEIHHRVAKDFREAKLYGWMPPDAWAFFTDPEY